ncbi:MAG: SRPBCC family protein [Candidatus Desantisbacteria bacterium]
MIHQKDSILIKQTLGQVFEIARDMEKLSEFIPEYKNVKTLNQGQDKIEVEVRIKLMGIPIIFVSSGIITPNQSIRYEQIKGPLKGLITEWRFEQVESKTQLSVIHTLNLRIPVLGRFLEGMIYNLVIKHMASDLLVNLKKEAERLV